MKIAVYGAGSIGAYFGGRLLEAGERVAFIARGSHLAALRRDGLTLRSPLGDAQLTTIEASDNPADIGPVDVVLLCTKTWQLGVALDAIDPLLGPETFVVPLQNGVEAAAQIANRVGAERVLPGTCKILSTLGQPGEVRHLGSTPWIAVGEKSGEPTPRLEALVARLRGAGIVVDVASDIEAVLWEKLLFVASMGAVGAVTRAPVGVVRQVPATRAMLEAAMDEVRQVAQARGVGVSDEATADAMRFVDGLPPHGSSSLQRDLADGRPSELEAQSGAIVRLARAVAVAAPVHGCLYASLLPLELRARGEQVY